MINLSPAKPQVIQGVYDALKEGGEFYFSDIYCDRRLPEAVQKHEGGCVRARCALMEAEQAARVTPWLTFHKCTCLTVLWGECLAGALCKSRCVLRGEQATSSAHMFLHVADTGDFVRICRNVGFTDPRILSIDPVEVNDPELKEVVGNAKFYSITYRLFKLKVLETECEDYGQVATYKGTIPGHAHSYMLDDHHVFETGRPMLVCGNSAAMVGDSWLGKHFEVLGGMSTHFGLFDCSTPAASSPTNPGGAAACAPTLDNVGGGCC